MSHDQEDQLAAEALAAFQAPTHAPGHGQTMSDLTRKDVASSGSMGGKTSKRGRSAEGSSDGKGDADDDEGEGEDASKPLKNTKRAAQNRAAQRAFRERKEQYVNDLERKSKLFDEVIAREAGLLATIDELRAQLEQRLTPPATPSTTIEVLNDHYRHRESEWMREKSDLVARQKAFEGQARDDRLAIESFGLDRAGLRGALDESRRENAELRRVLAGGVRRT